jgi:hypothetical protein
MMSGGLTEGVQNLVSEHNELQNKLKKLTQKL